MNEAGIVMASAGIDSTVLAFMLAEKRKLGGLFFVDYGQASAGEQYTKLLEVAKQLGSFVHREKVTLPPYMEGSGRILGKRRPLKMASAYEALDKDPDGAWFRDVWDYIPMRNTLFMVYAAAFAWERGMEVVYTGFQFDEPEWERMYDSGYMGFDGCDTSEVFIEAFNDLLDNGGLPGERLTFDAPFLTRRWSKERIIEEGLRLVGERGEAPVRRVDRIDSLDRLTYSCEFSPVCGACRGCLTRGAVFARLRGA